MKCSDKFRLAAVHNCYLYFADVTLNLNSNSKCDFEPDFIFGKDIVYNESDFRNCTDICDSGCKEWKYEDVLVTYPKESNGNDTTGSIDIRFEERRKLLMISMLSAYSWDQVLSNIGGLHGL